MRRVQIHLEEAVDDALAAEAARRGISKAQLIRDMLDQVMPDTGHGTPDPLDALVGAVDVDPADIDDVVYG